MSDELARASEDMRAFVDAERKYEKENVHPAWRRHSVCCDLFPECSHMLDALNPDEAA